MCIDMRWEDPRTGDELQSARIAAAGYDYQGNMNDVDVSYTVSGDGVEIKFENPLEVVQWRGDGRLRDFEQSFFAEGGKLNAVVSWALVAGSKIISSDLADASNRPACRASEGLWDREREV